MVVEQESLSNYQDSPDLKERSGMSNDEELNRKEESSSSEMDEQNQIEVVKN